MTAGPSVKNKSGSSGTLFHSMVHDSAGSDEFTAVKGYLEKGLEVLEEELRLFEGMLKKKKLI